MIFHTSEEFNVIRGIHDRILGVLTSYLAYFLHMLPSLPRRFIVRTPESKLWEITAS